jgi:hypothetical protein
MSSKNVTNHLGLVVRWPSATLPEVIASDNGPGMAADGAAFEPARFNLERTPDSKPEVPAVTVREYEQILRRVFPHLVKVPSNSSGHANDRAD